MKYLKILCRLADAKLECIINDTKEVIEPVERGGYRLYNIAYGGPFRYEMEITMPVSERMFCNAEYYGEFVWGGERILRFETLKPINRLLCISGELKIYEHKNIITVLGVGDEISDVLLDKINVTIEYLRYLSEALYSKYVALSRSLSQLIEDYIPPYIRLHGDLWLSDLIASCDAIINSFASIPEEYLNTLIRYMADSLAGRRSLLTLDDLKKLCCDRDYVIECYRKYQCISVNETNDEIVIINRCNDNILFKGLFGRGLIELKLGERDSIRLSKRIFGHLIEWFALG